MKFFKVCMQCGNEFETEKLFDDILTCPKCGSGDVYQAEDEEMTELSLEDCFVTYHNKKVACICCADEKEVIFCKE